jgi:hypothetical protein
MNTTSSLVVFIWTSVIMRIVLILSTILAKKGLIWLEPHKILNKINVKERVKHLWQNYGKRMKRRGARTVRIDR